MPIKAIVFDAYGTLYDVHSVRTLATELTGAKGELVTQLWRLKQIEYSWLKSLMHAYEDLWSLTRASLGVNPKEVLFVSSNGFDVAGAKRFGFRVAWIERTQGTPPPAS